MAAQGGGFFSQLMGMFGGGRAAGGPVFPGYGYTVGEQGPEKFVPTVPGHIEPAANTNIDSGAVTVNVDMTTGGGSAPSSQDALEFGRRVKQAVVGVIQNEQRPGGSLYQRKSA
jgi:hypothetical protein